MLDPPNLPVPVFAMSAPNVPLISFLCSSLIGRCQTYSKVFSEAFVIALIISSFVENKPAVDFPRAIPTAPVRVAI